MSLYNLNHKNDLLAYFCAFTAQVIFPFSNIYAIEHNFSIYEINLIRAIMTICLCFFIARMKNIDLNYALRCSFRPLMVRSVLCVVWIGVMTWCLYYLSLAVIYSINICGSLCVFVWDVYLYDMRINNRQKIGVACGIAGAVMVINANYFLSKIDPTYAMHTTFQYFKSDHVSDTIYAAFLLFLANIGTGYAFSITKSVKIQKSGSEYNLSFSFVLLIFSTIGMMLDQKSPPK
jgi:drug/metabolite transporter (DMT)-like permease